MEVVAGGNLRRHGNPRRHGNQRFLGNQRYLGNHQLGNWVVDVLLGRDVAGDNEVVVEGKRTGVGKGPEGDKYPDVDKRLEGDMWFEMEGKRLEMEGKRPGVPDMHLGVPDKHPE